MTISSQTNRWIYNGDGSTKAFPYTNKIFATGDLVVTVDGLSQVLNTDYTVSGIASENGGSVTFTTAPATGTGNVVIVRSVPYTQGIDIPLGGAFPASSVEDGLDKTTVLAQQVKDGVDRSLKQPASDITDIGALPTKTDRAGKLLGFDGDGEPLVGPSTATLALTYTEDFFTGDGATTGFTLSATPGAQSLVEVWVDGVRQYPGAGEDYLVAGASLAFISGAPANNAEIFVRYGQSYGGVPSDGSVSEVKLANDAVDWDTKVKHETAGDLPYFGASGVPARLSGGVAGQTVGFASGVPALVANGPPGFIKGCVPSSAPDSAHDITFTAGSCINAAGTKLLTLPAYIKQFDATFAEGDTAGGFGVALPTSGTYHIFVITKDADGTVDYFGDTSSSGANKPNGWTVEREVFRLITDGSGNFFPFDAYERAGGGIEVNYRSSVNSSTTAITTTSALVPLHVPIGKQVEAFVAVTVSSNVGTGGGCLLTCPDQDDVVATVSSVSRASFYGAYTGTSAQTQSDSFRVRTDNNGRIRIRGTLVFASSFVDTFGWIDERNV